MKENIATILYIILIVGVLALSPVYNQWAYGDWTCMFKHCVQVKDRK